MDRLDNAKIVSDSDSKSVQVWESTVGCSASASTMETRSIQGGTKISNVTQGRFLLNVDPLVRKNTNRGKNNNFKNLRTINQIYTLPCGHVAFKTTTMIHTSHFLASPSIFSLW